MDISPTALVNTSLMMQQSQVGQAADMEVLKKALNIQASSVMTLMDSLPLASSGTIGTRINTVA
jgi:hypothetical protein